MNAVKVPGFTAEMSLHQCRTPFYVMVNSMGSDVSGVIPQMPKWLKCTLAISAQTAACLGGPNPACLAAAAAALDVCL